MIFCQKSSKFYEKKKNEKIVDFVKGYPYDFLLKITKISWKNWSISKNVWSEWNIDESIRVSRRMRRLTIFQILKIAIGFQVNSTLSKPYWFPMQIQWVKSMLFPIVFQFSMDFYLKSNTIYQILYTRHVHYNQNGSSAWKRISRLHSWFFSAGCDKSSISSACFSAGQSDTTYFRKHSNCPTLPIPRFSSKLMKACFNSPVSKSTYRTLWNSLSIWVMPTLPSWCHHTPQALLNSLQSISRPWLAISFAKLASPHTMGLERTIGVYVRICLIFFLSSSIWNAYRLWIWGQSFISGFFVVVGRGKFSTWRKQRLKNIMQICSQKVFAEHGRFPCQMISTSMKKFSIVSRLWILHMENL